MNGKGILRENFQPRTCSGKKTPTSGQVKGSHVNVILIDVESDQVNDVVIIDEPEFLQGKSHGSSVPRRDRKCPVQGVISINDDDSDDAYHPGIVAEGVGELDSDASSSKIYSPAPGYMRSSVHLNVDDYHDVREKVSAFNMPKSRPTCSAKAADRNRYSLDGSESMSSDSDCSDCELMEVREEWEKASVKRKRHVRNDQTGFDGEASSSGFYSNIYTDIEVENRTGQHAGSPSNGKCVKQNLSSSSFMGDSQMDRTNCNLRPENSCKYYDQKVDQERFKIFRFGCKEEMQSLHQNARPQTRERTRREDFSSCTKCRSCNIAGGVNSDSRFKKDMGGKESKYMGSNLEESEKKVDDNVSALNERHANYDGVVSQQSCDRWHHSGLGAEDIIGPAPEDRLFCKPQSVGKSRVSNCSEVEVTADSEVSSVYNTLDDDLQDKQDRSCMVGNEKPSDIGDALHAQDNDITNSDERDIINEREKLKETDEYKRTIEEEWASRQRQLKIQAEEAQRLRKRKKAESIRLLDMQRRQKERIEEVRETQKKDEENMNMKEKLRVEIRKGLNKLEMTCTDMASLLHCLGIQAGGGINPSPQQVHAAYKRAVLKFHPDRALKSDLREQVEAEEKFKLISRMKEKFLSTCSY